MSSCGIVVIGRNEGERLRACLASTVTTARPVVYVDSGSTDDSLSLARGFGSGVVELDMRQPFTAARARNAGRASLLATYPALEWIQFVDGDCEVAANWLERAESALANDASLAVVCGRRRERYPDASIYNRLCDIEWNTPVGLADACGGDAMFRARAFDEVGGFDPTLIAGEEPELCFRLRARGWKILRIDAEMTLHDAAMTAFHQWWMRAKRAGHAFAEVSSLHADHPERFWVREARSGIVWGLALPLLLLTMAPVTRGGSLAMLLASHATVARRAERHLLSRGFTQQDARLFGAFCALSKYPAAQGALKYYFSRLSGAQRTLIEYKS